MIKMKQVDLRTFQSSDERGWGLNPIKAAGLADQEISNLHVVSLRPGAIRGNHYHQTVTEWLLVFGGPATIIWRSRTDSSQHEVVLDKEGPTLFEIPPQIEHALVNNSTQDYFIIAFYNGPDSEAIPASKLRIP